MAKSELAKICQFVPFRITAPGFPSFIRRIQEILQILIEFERLLLLKSSTLREKTPSNKPGKVLYLHPLDSPSIYPKTNLPVRSVGPASVTVTLINVSSQSKGRIEIDS